MFPLLSFSLMLQPSPLFPEDLPHSVLIGIPVAYVVILLLFLCLHLYSMWLRLHLGLLFVYFLGSVSPVDVVDLFSSKIVLG